MLMLTFAHIAQIQSPRQEHFWKNNRHNWLLKRALDMIGRVALTLALESLRSIDGTTHSICIRGGQPLRTP